MNHSDKVAPFHVQSRLVEHRGRVVVRDETRHADAHSRDEAGRIAQVLGGEGFTVWIWALDTRSVPAGWTLLDRIDPPREALNRRAIDLRRARADRQRVVGRAEAVTA
ncbi:hypothetical protein [Pseudonocardia sp. GCM10023141]|uniref:hypothetical protein n=1 Tax=Pseudonocardia sp. GCM10023141 TaxID=3252653 RepID=UPI00360DA9FE